MQLQNVILNFKNIEEIKNYISNVKTQSVSLLFNHDKECKEYIEMHIMKYYDLNLKKYQLKKIDIITYNGYLRKEFDLNYEDFLNIDAKVI